MSFSKKVVCPAVLFATVFSINTAQANDVVVQGLDVVDAASDMPMGQSSSGSQSLLPEDDTLANDDSLFGVKGGGYVHPFISISGEYTDNLFNLDTGKTENFLTTINPGIWLSLPSRKDIPLHIAPNNTSSGGLQSALDDYVTFDRMNVYLLGSLAYKMYSTDSELDDWDGRLEGLFKYNLRSGLSFQFVDSMTKGQDRFDVENSSVEDKRQFYTNLFDTNADWEFTEKLRAKIEYSNFYLDYDEIDDEWMNRTDNAISLYGFYKYSIKTSLFLQYRYVDVAYDTSTLRDADHNFIYGGFNWTTTDKTAMRFKIGYQKRSYKNSTINSLVDANVDDNDTSWTMQAALDYYVTEKTKLIISVDNSIEETDSYNSLDKEVLVGNIHYEQELKQNLTGLCDFRYENSDYTQVGSVENRDDDRYYIRPALQYVLQDWLMAELSYTYDTRNSTDDYFDYKSNTISLSLNGAL